MGQDVQNMNGYPLQGAHIQNAPIQDTNYQYQDDNDGEDDSGDGDVQKGKRRSKNDVEGRDFKCSFCTKTYLSYPALYTHVK